VGVDAARQPADWEAIGSNGSVTMGAVHASANEPAGLSSLRGITFVLTGSASSGESVPFEAFVSYASLLCAESLPAESTAARTVRRRPAA